MVKRHTKPTQKNPQGGIVDKEGSIHISNVPLFDDKPGKRHAHQVRRRRRHQGPRRREVGNQVPDRRHGKGTSHG